MARNTGARALTIGRRAYAPPPLLSAVCLAALGALVPSRDAGAGLIVTTGAAAPSTRVIEQFEVGSTSFNSDLSWRTSSGWPHWAPRHRDIGQSFRVDEPNDVWLETLTLHMGSLGAMGTIADAGFHLEVWSVTDASDASGNVLLSSQSGSLPGSGAISSAIPYWTFDFDDVLVQHGHTYAIMLALDGSDVERSLFFANTWGGDYGYGRQMARIDGVWDGSFSKDLWFYVQGSQTPEPTSGVLVGGLTTIGALVRWRRRRGSSPCPEQGESARVALGSES